VAAVSLSSTPRTRRAAAMDMLAVLAYSVALTVLALAYFDILTF
jgi:hypothetical protein